MPYTEALSVLKSIRGESEVQAQHKLMSYYTPEVTMDHTTQEAPPFFTVPDIHTYIGVTGTTELLPA